MDEEPPSVEAFYDASAAFYAEEVEGSPLREHCRLPAVRGLSPDLNGLRVLEAGCGAGSEATWLAKRGADVVGIDVSEGMLDEAVEPTLTEAFAEATPGAAAEFRGRVPDVFCLRASPR